MDNVVNVYWTKFATCVPIVAVETMACAQVFCIIPVHMIHNLISLTAFKCLQWWQSLSSRLLKSSLQTP
jgi:hypothetical protein